MTLRKPLVLINGTPRQLPPGDAIEGAGEGGGSDLAATLAALEGTTALESTDALIVMREGTLLKITAQDVAAGLSSTFEAGLFDPDIVE
jgi:hypothetical protein